MMATTMLDTISSLLGVPLCAIPLSSCRPARTYLLERAGIPMTGTVLLFAVPYVVPEDVFDPKRNVSLYAVPRDYHGYMDELAHDILPVIKRAYPEYRFALFADHSPIREVDAAARAGLGVVGEHGLLITETYGSFVFIGEIVTDADYRTVTGHEIPAIPEKPTMCERCGACVRACPARREGNWISPCLSALTQKKGHLTEEEIALLTAHTLVWGCDSCQLVCPHNRRSIERGKGTDVPYFIRDRLNHVDSTVLDQMSDEAFSGRAYAWRGRAVITRNCQSKEEKP